MESGSDLLKEESDRQTNKRTKKERPNIRDSGGELNTFANWQIQQIFLDGDSWPSGSLTDDDLGK